MVELEEELRAIEVHKQQLIARQKLAAQRAQVERRRAEAAREEKQHLQVTRGWSGGREEGARGFWLVSTIGD
jgi:hypothetical protein